MTQASAPVRVGQDSREILEELNCTPDEIDAILAGME